MTGLPWQPLPPAFAELVERGGFAGASTLQVVAPYPVSAGIVESFTVFFVECLRKELIVASTKITVAPTEVLLRMTKSQKGALSAVQITVACPCEPHRHAEMALSTLVPTLEGTLQCRSVG